MPAFAPREIRLPDPMILEKPMRTQWTLWTVAAFVGMTLLPIHVQAAAPRGLGDPGALTGLRIEPSREGQGILIRGRDSRQQLFVTGVYATGQLRDHTRSVQYAVEP